MEKTSTQKQRGRYKKTSRYELKLFEEHTNIELSKIYNVSTERIRQVRLKFFPNTNSNEIAESKKIYKHGLSCRDNCDIHKLAEMIHYRYSSEISRPDIAELANKFITVFKEDTSYKHERFFAILGDCVKKLQKLQNPQDSI